MNNLEDCYIQLFNYQKKTHTPTTPWRLQTSVRSCLRPPRCNTPLHDALLGLTFVLATKTYICRPLDMGRTATIVLPICNIYFKIRNTIYFYHFHVTFQNTYNYVMQCYPHDVDKFCTLSTAKFMRSSVFKNNIFNV